MSPDKQTGPLCATGSTLFSLCYLLLEKLSKSLIPLSDCPFVLNRLPVFLGKSPCFRKKQTAGPTRLRADKPSRAEGCHSDDHKGRPGATRPGASTFGAVGGLTCYFMPELTRDAATMPCSSPWGSA